MGGPSRARLELPPIEGVKAPLYARGTIGDGGGTRSRRCWPDLIFDAFLCSSALNCRPSESKLRCLTLVHRLGSMKPEADESRRTPNSTYCVLLEWTRCFEFGFTATFGPFQCHSNSASNENSRNRQNLYSGEDHGSSLVTYRNLTAVLGNYLHAFRHHNQNSSYGPLNPPGK